MFEFRSDRYQVVPARRFAAGGEGGAWGPHLNSNTCSTHARCEGAKRVWKITDMASKVIFLDRDGVLNVDHGYVHKIEDWEFCAGAIEAIRALREAGYFIAVVTNQSGVARGMFSLEDLHRLYEFVQQQLRQAGAAVDAIVYCPHAPEDNCPCRKPRTGMAQQIEKTIGDSIDYSESWMVGDKLSDIEFGLRLGTRTALIQSRYWREGELLHPPDITIISLWDAARQILDG